MRESASDSGTPCEGTTVSGTGGMKPACALRPPTLPSSTTLKTAGGKNCSNSNSGTRSLSTRKRSFATSKE